MTMSVRVRGDGVAARCCAHLLNQAGCRVSFEATSRPRVPAIMLGDAAQQLIRDIFQQDHLFRDLPRISKRIVAWGPHAIPVELNHSAVVVSEEFLLNTLGQAVNEEVRPDWTIYSAPPLPGSTEEHRLGSRMASPMAVELKAGAEPNACWIESVEDGWLFLNAGWLLAVGEHPLEKSKLVKEQIAQVDSAIVSFPGSPRMVTPLGGDRWIACGSAAMAFDPLCGDGTAHAIREAILASAVMRAIARGEEPGPLLAHYEARLIAGFQRHLAQCREFYLSGGSSPWWTSEAGSAVRGLEWARCRLESHGGFQYQLLGLELARL
jgi:hypothetical protein